MPRTDLSSYAARAALRWFLNGLDAVLASQALNALYEAMVLACPWMKRAPGVLRRPVRALTRALMPPNLKIGIIMDGNRRFARKYGLSVKAGHLQGYQRMIEMISYLEEVGCHQVAFFAFGQKNYQRTPQEVGDIMDIFERGMAELKQASAESRERRASLEQLHIVGDADAMPERVARQVAEINSSGAGGKSVYVLFSYSSLSEYVRSKQDGPVQVDLILRPGGESRLSDFLLCSAASQATVSFQAVKWPMIAGLHLLGAVLKHRVEALLR